MNQNTEESMSNSFGEAGVCRFYSLRRIGSGLLTFIQFIPLLEGWISYLLGSIIASLFTPISFLSLLWYPVDVIFKYIWMGCDWMKHKLWGQNFDRAFSSRRWDSYFPAF